MLKHEAGRIEERKVLWTDLGAGSARLFYKLGKKWAAFWKRQAGGILDFRVGGISFSSCLAWQLLPSAAVRARCGLLTTAPGKVLCSQSLVKGTCSLSSSWKGGKDLLVLEYRGEGWWYFCSQLIWNSFQPPSLPGIFYSQAHFPMLSQVDSLVRCFKW